MSGGAASSLALQAREVSVALAGRPVLTAVSLEVRPGEVLAVVGPNGAGKSTLLGALSGELVPTGGEVTVGGRPLHRIPHRERARLRSVLTQENTVSFSFTVRAVVELGRNPWMRVSSAAEDERAVEDAIAATDIGHLLDRPFPALSGGEKARVSLARVLAQDAPVVLLDEPTAALDLAHQEDVMRIARQLAGSGRAVAMVLHDLSLAGAYADRIALVDEGRLAVIGAPDAVLSPERIGPVYGLEVEVLPHAGRPLVVPVRD